MLSMLVRWCPLPSAVIVTQLVTHLRAVVTIYARHAAGLYAVGMPEGRFLRHGKHVIIAYG